MLDYTGKQADVLKEKTGSRGNGTDYIEKNRFDISRGIG